ncbi:MAG: DUF2840 domain-containing protein [Phycisphaera sp.]|nr:DUF2840 domain-containing protein [Phycisphaera sp.]
MPTDRNELTRLTAFHARKRLLIRMRFGDPTRSRRLDSGVTHYWFMPGQLFAVMWWARLSPRKQVACFAIVEALRAGDVGYVLPCVQPAVAVHTYLNTRCVGKDRGVVALADELVTHIERQGVDPCDVAGSYYATRRRPRRSPTTSPSWSAARARGPPIRSSSRTTGNRPTASSPPMR